MAILRINEEDLYDEDDYCPHWKGVKFTGIGYETGLNGVIHTETSYKEGIKHGTYLEFNEVGTILKKGYNKDGYSHGIWKEWNNEEKLIRLVMYNNANLIYEHKWNSSGILYYKKYVQKLGTRIVNTYSKEQFFFEDGSLQKEAIYEYGILVKSKTWSPDGTLVLPPYEVDCESPEYKHLLSYGEKSTSENPFYFSK